MSDVKGGVGSGCPVVFVCGVTKGGVRLRPAPWGDKVSLFPLQESKFLLISRSGGIQGEGVKS